MRTEAPSNSFTSSSRPPSLMKILLASRFYPLIMAEIVLIMLSLTFMSVSLEMSSTSSIAPELIDWFCTKESFWFAEAMICKAMILLSSNLE